MKMTEKEYEELIAHFNFVADKVENCYEKEIKQWLERMKKEYKQHVNK